MSPQVKGLQTEYQRLLDTGGGYEGAAKAGDAAKLREEVRELKALEPQLQEARQAQSAAERNLQVHPFDLPPPPSLLSGELRGRLRSRVCAEECACDRAL